MAEETNTGENKSTRKDLSWIETIKERKLKTENWKSTVLLVTNLREKYKAKSSSRWGIEAKK